MAGLRGNVAWLLAQAQTAKGALPTISTTKAYKMPFSGGSIGPTRTTDRLSETDASRDAGVAYVQQTGVEGSPEFYVRDASIGFWLWLALGADAVTGTTNFVHTLTPANALPYVTMWRDLGDTLYEQFLDCKVGSLSISAEAGSPLTATAGVQGLQPSRLTASPDISTPVTIESGQVYNFNNATVTLGGSATALVRSMELTIENNLTVQQTDDSVPYDVVEGIREVSLGFDLIFETLAEYNKFHYGGAAGTAISPTIFTTSADFTFSLGINNSVGFTLPSIAYEEFPVEPDAGGDPIVASVRAVGQRSGSPILTATVKNQVATYSA
jgi:hypothetical protein